MTENSKQPTTDLETSPSELEFTSFFTDDNDGTDPNYPYQEIEKYLETHPKEKQFFILSGPQIGTMKYPQI